MDKNSYTALPIEMTFMEMSKYAYVALAQFPKSEKYALAADIKRCMDNVLGYIIEAKKKYTKKTTLQYLDIEVDKLRFYIRLSKELGFLSMNKYDVWSRYVDNIGSQVGGWIGKQPKGAEHSRTAVGPGITPPPTRASSR